MPEERIQKVLATAGVASRRAAEVLVAAGRVRIDGRMAVVGQKVDAARSTIEVDGTPVGVGVARAYVALHKPAGVTSTTRDPHAAATVLDLVPTALVPDGTRLYPVGRLDQDSEGLLLLTNDGGWAERVLHPRFGVEREYALALARPLSPEQARELNAGIHIDEGLAKLTAPLRAATGVETRNLVATLDPEPDPGLIWYRAILAQGWKRQLRRMFGGIEAPIVRLVRVRIGPVRLADLRSGHARILKAPEIRGLAAGGGRARAVGRSPSPRPATSRSSSPQVLAGTSGRSGSRGNSAPKAHSSGDASGSIKHGRALGRSRSGQTRDNEAHPPSHRDDYPIGIARKNVNPRGARADRETTRRTAGEGASPAASRPAAPRPAPPAALPPPTPPQRGKPMKRRTSRHRET